MHFLSHYFVELPNKNPLFVAGLIIPDLTPGFSKIYNSIIKNAVAPENENLLQIHEGILSHYRADKWFHHSDLFMQHTTMALQSFLKEGLNRDNLRLSVIAHLTIEMMIDRQIILENKWLCDDFYKAIVQTDESLLETYFLLLDTKNSKSSFFATFKFFKERKFLYRFEDIENIVFGLSKVYGSVTTREFTEEEKRRFVTALHNIDNTIRYSWQAILKV